MKLDYNRESLHMLESAMESPFWKWIHASLETELNRTMTEITFGDTKDKKPEHFWELRAYAKSLKALLDLPNRKANAIREVLNQDKTQGFIRSMFKTSPQEPL